MVYTVQFMHECIYHPLFLVQQEEHLVDTGLIEEGKRRSLLRMYQKRMHDLYQ